MTTKDEVVAAVLTKSLEVASATGQFIQEQAPEVVQQLLMWKFTEACTVACALALLVGMSVWKFPYKDLWDPYDLDWSPIIVGIIQAILVIPTFCYGLIALKIAIAPKLYLLEYAASLVK